MVRVQVGQEYLVQEVVGDHQCRDVDHGAAANIEQELVAITEFCQPTGRRLVAAGSGQLNSLSRLSLLNIAEYTGFLLIRITSVRLTW